MPALFRIGRLPFAVLCAASLFSCGVARSAEAPSAPTALFDDAAQRNYFARQTARLQTEARQIAATPAAWHEAKPRLQRELREMLGLEPLPERTPLQAQVTGRVERDEFVVEKIHFQSRPGLYVTGNLYLPKQRSGRVPAILYLCGHGAVKKGAVSFGNKVHYQHHGAWFARHGYACLAIDSLQLGEIEGIHHGTYRYDRWWWLTRGYTPAGVEAWNCVRALDYLQTREEIDGTRLGCTGRSGGGAYSWWIAALDPRIGCAVPVAGICDLQNHVVEGCVDGHCDCMYVCNTYQWDYPLVAALVAPRPLLVSNTDTDRIFPLDGVVRTFDLARRAYAHEGAADKIGLNIGPGGHDDTQDLQVACFRWFDKHLLQVDRAIVRPAEKFFEPEELRVFGEKLPADERNTTVDAWFVAQAPRPALPENGAAWEKTRTAAAAQLKEKTFRSWPREACPLQVTTAFSVAREGIRLAAYDFDSEPGVRLRMYALHVAGKQKAPRAVVGVLNESAMREKFLAALAGVFPDELKEFTLPAASPNELERYRRFDAESPALNLYFAPRGEVPCATDAKRSIHDRRRYYLLGESLAGQQCYDMCRAVTAAREIGKPFGVAHVQLGAWGSQTVPALCAAILEPQIEELMLGEIPENWERAPALLNLGRVVDSPPTLLALAAARAKTQVVSTPVEMFDFAFQVGQKCDWPADRLEISPAPPGAP